MCIWEEEKAQRYTTSTKILQQALEGCRRCKGIGGASAAWHRDANCGNTGLISCLLRALSIGVSCMQVYVYAYVHVHKTLRDLLVQVLERSL